MFSSTLIIFVSALFYIVYADCDEIEDYLNNYAQDDPQLVKVIKDYYLYAPAPKDSKYNLVRYDYGHQMGQFLQAHEISRLFPNKTNGFFIEAGAYDGENLSNTLLFELYLNWTGILVEPSPEPFEKLINKNRRAWSINHCLSTQPHAETVNFDSCGLYGGIIKENHIKPGDNLPDHTPELKKYLGINRQELRMQCFPLFSILSALGNPTVDYLSLDMEGTQLDVLKTIPWEKVNISVISIEVVRRKYNSLDHGFVNHFPEINELMLSKGYFHYKTLRFDEIYIRKDFQIPPEIDLEKEFKKSIIGLDDGSEVVMSVHH